MISIFTSKQDISKPYLELRAMMQVPPENFTECIIPHHASLLEVGPVVGLHVCEVRLSGTVLAAG